jgi:hypothetical protein
MRNYPFYKPSRHNLDWKNCYERLIQRALAGGKECIETSRPRQKSHWARGTIYREVCRLKYGEPLLYSLCLHKCHNEYCINADHLRWGSAQDNANDRVSRNMGIVYPGVRNEIK